MINMIERYFIHEFKYLYELYIGSKTCLLHSDISECFTSIQESSFSVNNTCWFGVFTKILRSECDTLNKYSQKPDLYKSLKLKYGKSFAKWVMGYWKITPGRRPVIHRPDYYY